jgi:hypothetical protein
VSQCGSQHRVTEDEVRPVMSRRPNHRIDLSYARQGRRNRLVHLVSELFPIHTMVLNEDTGNLEINMPVSQVRTAQLVLFDD